MNAPAYRKLPAKGFGGQGFARLWLGDGELLASVTWFTNERYRRYYLRDIEAIVVRETNGRLIWNLIFAFVVALGALASSFFVFMGSRDSESDGQVLGFVLGGLCAAVWLPCLIALLVNTLRGPVCRAWVRVGGRYHALPAPGRTRQLEALVAVLGAEMAHSSGAKSEIRNPKSETILE